MRDARYRFSDEVRGATRAIAARTVYAGEVAATPEALGAWIARTDDLREKLIHGGYGTEFDAADLFPLYQGFVAKATAATPAPAAARPSKWIWIGAIVVVLAAVIVAVIVVS